MSLVRFTNNFPNTKRGDFTGVVVPVTTFGLTMTGMLRLRALALFKHQDSSETRLPTVDEI